ncbi:MAG: hypothetical protein Q9183_000525 [Haloplaca sp. 2 TL-2023]
MDRNFKELQGEVTSALVKTTRTANQISNEDLAFHRSVNPEVDRLLEQQNQRLLALARDLNKTATTGTGAAPPPLKNAESVDDGWRGIVDIVDNLLEKADACLDEFTGMIKKLAPSRKDEPSPPSSTKAPISRSLLRAKNIPKPQRLFRTLPVNDATTPFKPLLQSKPHAIVPLEESVILGPDSEGSMHYTHPYQAEIAESKYPSSAYIQSDPIPYLPFESTTALWVDTPDAVQEMLQDLRKAKEIAVDLEHHDTYSYVGLVSLMQISTREKDWVVDTLLPWREDLQILNEVFTDPSIVKVFHGSNMDMVWLQRDLGLYVVGLFDTFHAARVLSYPRKGLKGLQERFTDYVTDKRYQMADWRVRPLPEQMYDYARSDTHFLLYIYDKIRNELLQNSSPSSLNGNLINDVQESSKAEALQRYERSFYDFEDGSGPDGWRALLNRMPGTGAFNGAQLELFRALHQWRDKTAREKDESTNHVLNNQCLFTLAKEMPADIESFFQCLSGQGGPPSNTVRASAAYLVELIGKMKQQRGHRSSMNWNKRQQHTSRPFCHAESEVPARAAASQSTAELATSIVPAVSGTSRFWGATLGGVGPDSAESKNVKQAEKPCLALPLPPLTAEIFEAPASDGIAGSAEPRLDPGARAEHQYTKKRKPPDEDVFTIKDVNGVKKRKFAEPLDGPEPILVRNEVNGEPRDQLGSGNGEELEISLNGMDDDEEEQKQRRRDERKLQKRLLKAQRQQEGLAKPKGKGGARAQDGGFEAFDYENAPSILHAQKGNERRGGATKGFDPYAKALNAPKGLPKVQKEGPGRSMTYRK